MNATAAFPISQITGLRSLRAAGIASLEMVLSRLGEDYQEACKARLTIMEGDTEPENRSWRKMLVGALARIKLQNGEYITVTGYNTKRTSKINCPTRRCAEERILDELHRIHKERPIEYIVALVVVGDFQVDDESGVDCSTLHPCGNCRRKLELNEFMRDLTIVVTAQPPNESGQPQFAEIHTKKDLIANHLAHGQKL